MAPQQSQKKEKKKNRAQVRRKQHRHNADLGSKMLAGYRELLPRSVPTEDEVKAYSMAEKQMALRILKHVQIEREVREGVDARQAGAGEGAGAAVTGTANLENAFTCFGKLPIELRLSIWEFTFLPDTQPRVHSICDVGELPCCQAHERLPQWQPEFLSNQPISVIRQVCKEARTLYLAKTNNKFAFGTFVDFDMDTIYYCNKEASRIDWIRFLNYEDTLQIKNFAMPSHVFVDLPTEIEDDPALLHIEMAGCMLNWTKMYIVFGDKRTMDQTNEDVALEFRELAGREKRKNEAPAKVRRCLKYFADWFLQHDEKERRQIEWHYSAINKQEELES